MDFSFIFFSSPLLHVLSKFESTQGRSVLVLGVAAHCDIVFYF